MARIVGVDLPKNKRGEIGLTYILGEKVKILTDFPKRMKNINS